MTKAQSSARRVDSREDLERFFAKRLEMFSIRCEQRVERIRRRVKREQAVSAPNTEETLVVRLSVGSHEVDHPASRDRVLESIEYVPGVRS